VWIARIASSNPASAWMTVTYKCCVLTDSDFRDLGPDISHIVCVCVFPSSIPTACSMKRWGCEWTKTLQVFEDIMKQYPLGEVIVEKGMDEISE
jgi:hypothetical protein